MWKRALGHGVCICAVLVGATSCGASQEQSGRSEKQEHRVSLEPITDETCSLIFDDETLREVHANRLTRRVHVPADDLLFQAVSVRMRHHMKHFKEEMGGCLVEDKNKRPLIEITTNWGSSPFPEDAEESGKNTYYHELSDRKSARRFELLVKCNRPGLAKKAKLRHQLPVRLMMIDRVGLSKRARASLLSNGGKKLTEHLSCRNNIAYPEPESVHFF